MQSPSSSSTPPADSLPLLANQQQQLEALQAENAMLRQVLDLMTEAFWAVDRNWSITAAFVGAAMATSLVAGHFGTKVDTDRLQRWFAYLVFAVAAYVLVDTIIFR